jgi:hypothetical protein
MCVCSIACMRQAAPPLVICGEYSLEDDLWVFSAMGSLD